MNSELLEQIGLDKIDPAYFIAGLLAVCIGLLAYIIAVHVKLRKLCEKYDRFLRGKDAETLEEVIYKRFDEIDNLVVADRVKSKQIQEIYENLKIAYQKVGIVKYDAFNEMGGKLSFALCVLDKENNGYLINAMHSREGCYTYIKEIVKGESYIALGNEEEEALKRAVSSENYME